MTRRCADCDMPKAVCRELGERAGRGHAAGGRERAQGRADGREGVGDAVSPADAAFAHELRGEQAERDAEQARELETLERMQAAGVEHLAGFQVINDVQDLVAHAKRAERYRQCLSALWTMLDEFDLKLANEELHEPVDHVRPRSEQLLASEVIEGAKAIIGRMYR